jgi:acetyltransferase-like isoleucine patch superfamily enzyme
MNSIPQTTVSGTASAGKPTLRHRLATSKAPLPRFLKWAYWQVNGLSVPAPKAVVLPAVWIFLFVRDAYYFAMRVFICEPFFKACCTKYGRNLHTDAHLHWIAGKGDIIIGDNVSVVGKVDIGFAARFADRPRLEIGDNTGIGGGCSFAIGKLISIGRNCTLSGGIQIMDSNGHDTDPGSRWRHEPPKVEDVRPVLIRDNVWIGRNCIIFPGVKVGEGSVISAASIVRSHVPPYSVVAGNPARVMFRLKKPEQTGQEPG